MSREEIPSELQVKAIRKASREKSRDFNGVTRIVPLFKTKREPHKSTRQYLLESE